MEVSRKKFLIFTGLIIGLLLAVALIFFWKAKSAKVVSPVGQEVESPGQAVLPSKNYLVYQDAAGFSFEYPDNVTISEKDIDETVGYAKLELNSADVVGGIKIAVVDSKLSKAADWFENNNVEIADFKINKKELADLEAVEGRNDKKILLIALDKKVLFVFEVDLDKDGFWQKVYDQLSATFQFALPEKESPPAAAGSDGSSGIIFEGEEIIE